MVMLDSTENPRERVLDELEFLASLEAKTGDERALRIVRRLRALLSKPKDQGGRSALLHKESREYLQSRRGIIP